MKKGMKVSLSVAAAALLMSAPAAFAFHSGGVAECEGCHTMHNSLGGQVMNGATAQFTTGPMLLQGATQSSSCLNCHQKAGDTGPSSYHISTAESDMPAGTAPLQMTPGGDFGWLKKTYTWNVRGLNTSEGERKGHNVVAGDYNYVADATLTTAPGGTYPANQLHCSSCHDPHGKYRRFVDGSIATTGLPIKNSGSYNSSADPTAWGAVGAYRILGGTGYQPKSLSGSYAFANQVPAAVAPSTYNRTEATNQTRVAYGQGMSEWCANCHTDIHNSSYPTNLRHPAGNGAKFGATIAGLYNSYKKSGDLTGTQASAYLSLAPFEEGTADYTVLKAHAQINDSVLTGADATSNVNCLSCHRAHASGFDSMTRFNLAYEFTTIADASGNSVYGTGDPSASSSLQGRTVNEMTAAYYGRTADKFAPYQRALCNKCHAKD
ncbi:MULTISPECIES: c-type cytochrome OmcS [Geobacter]|uniref:Cytochrome C n=2 Tax=Geobacter TaxID=28231 RepID=A0A0C1TTM3_9BACT|nr:MULTISPECIES: c-type cytochrome OmcS [Geobacter]KIE44124.1 cytochrome C [Geobacter soli]MBE2887459.1 c-type cytochrome OmcS [Geobacter anodireducens]HMN03033.1 c-type cytochrome OmcS [Geobacter anodireducens]